MLKITALLNPTPSPGCEQTPTATPSRRQTGHRSASPVPAPRTAVPETTHHHQRTSSHRSSTAPMPRNKPKVRKEVGVFVLGTPIDPVKYPPHENDRATTGLSALDRDALLQQHHEHEIYPSERRGAAAIGDFCRSIPYKSDKRPMGSRADRLMFEVFQYTFVRPTDPEHKEYLIMWDYQVGLVRMTPFFKALGYKKTIHGKALDSNEGLKELACPVTGGDLAAQGYWLPYACARALCCTFCYPIRFALTPIFGPSFINDCIHPSGAGYRNFRISPSIIKKAQMDSHRNVSGSSVTLKGGRNKDGAMVDPVGTMNGECSVLSPRKRTAKAILKSEATSPSLDKTPFLSRASTTHVAQSPSISPTTNRFDFQSKARNLENSLSQASINKQHRARHTRNLRSQGVQHPHENRPPRLYNDPRAVADEDDDIERKSETLLDHRSPARTEVTHVKRQTQPFEQSAAEFASTPACSDNEMDIDGRLDTRPRRSVQDSNRVYASSLEPLRSSRLVDPSVSPHDCYSVSPSGETSSPMTTTPSKSTGAISKGKWRAVESPSDDRTSALQTRRASWRQIPHDVDTRLHRRSSRTRRRSSRIVRDGDQEGRSSRHATRGEIWQELDTQDDTDRSRSPVAPEDVLAARALLNLSHSRPGEMYYSSRP